MSSGGGREGEAICRLEKKNGMEDRNLQIKNEGGGCGNVSDEVHKGRGGGWA